MDRNKAHNKWKGAPHSATTSLMLLSAFSKQTNISRICFIQNCRHKQYKVTQEFFEKLLM